MVKSVPIKQSQTRDGLATPEQVAEFLSVSRSLVYMMLADGRLPHCKMGRLRRIRWEDVERYVKTCSA